jgi:hypothetical protein
MVNRIERVKKITGILLILMMAGLNFSASGQLAMGKWRTHLSYNAVNLLAQSTNKVFAVSSGSLFSVSKDDKSIVAYSKITGLSDNAITKIAFDSKSSQLIIVYANSNIDIFSSDGIFNVPDLYNKQSSIDKTVNSISFNGDYAYLSCKFGIVVVNMVKHEIADSYIIGTGGSNVSVLSTVVLGTKIFALINNALMQADLSNHNLANYQVWTAVSSFPGGTNSSLITFANAMWVLQGGIVYKSTDGITWSAVSGLSNIARMQSDDQSLFFISDTNSSTICYDKSLVATVLSGTAPQMITYDSNLKGFWKVNGDADGLIQVDATGKTINKYKPSGPFDNTAWQMKFAGDKLFVVPGGAWASQYNHPASIMMFQDNNWSYIDGAAIATQIGMSNVVDFVSIAVDPTDNTHFFATSYGMGLYEFRKNIFYKWYNSQNSAIESIFPGQGIELYYQRLDGAIFDKAGNIWFTNGQVSNSVKYLTPLGTIKSISFDLIKGKTNLNNILIDKLNINRKWGNITRYSPGIFVFDDNGTLDNTSDDKTSFLTSFTDQDGNTFTSDSYRCLAQDKNNQIWIGTSKGPIVVQTPGTVFSLDFTITRIKIPRNDGTDYADYLLGTEQVSAIKVDGANRKWIGTTTSGLYLVSENGQQTLQHFTTDNSPLLSNNIISLEINGTTGELFIGTDLGLISYQADASDAASTLSEIYVYPNPVRETYQGIITITGLVSKATIKITDINGNLIYQTTSNGGVATWNGKRVGGARVSTGVYLVISTSPDGSQSATTKILVIN